MPNVMHVLPVFLIFQHVQVSKFFRHKFLQKNIKIMFCFQFSACNCNVEGSNGITCDDNGICSCKANIINDKCDACASGFFDFPACPGN